jgi:RNA polymerase sigma factor (sigma-70 family)
MTPRFDLDTLLAETRWLSGLARQLVARSHDAEDLVQETLRTAIERPPSAGRPLRGWLRTVLLSRSRDTHRSERARTVREQNATPAAAVPSTVDVVVKAEVHGELVTAVLALDEPYRTCLLLRFFENLRPARDRAPLRGAGRHRAQPLQRALALLRQALARSHGHRWQLALAPLLRLRLAPSLLLGVPLVNALGKLTLSAAAIAVAVLVWQWPTAPNLERRDETASSVREHQGRRLRDRRRVRGRPRSSGHPAPDAATNPRHRPKPRRRRGSCAGASSTCAAPGSPACSSP